MNLPQQRAPRRSPTPATPLRKVALHPLAREQLAAARRPSVVGEASFVVGRPFSPAGVVGGGVPVGSESFPWSPHTDLSSLGGAGFATELHESLRLEVLGCRAVQ